MSNRPFQPPDDFESLLSTQRKSSSELDRDFSQLSEDSRRAVADNQRTIKKFFGILLIAGLALGGVTSIGVVYFMQWLRSTTFSEPQTPTQSQSFVGQGVATVSLLSETKNL